MATRPKYFDELKRAMEFLAKDPRTLFLGQAVEVPGTAMSNTLKDVPQEKLLELPVDEEMQMGMTNGLAIAGQIPVSIFPRWNFLLLAVNQIVNHLDKFPLMSNGGYRPKVIIRTGIGSERPLHPQHQHVGDFTEAFRLMCGNIEVIRLDEPELIFPAYEKALTRTDGKSTLLVEWGDFTARSKPMPATTSARPVLNWPLMENNILREDLDALIRYLQQPEPMLTQSAQVRAFEEEWSKWLGVRYSVFVNSGSSANLITMCALRELRGPGEVIVPTLTWVSDIASVLQAGFTPVFVDIDPHTLGMDVDQVLAKVGPNTRAVFLTHILGYNAVNQKLLDGLKAKNIPLIEDVCESHGATFRGKKCGSMGWASNFSFYYAHHMSTIEGGIISTDDPELYQTLRMFRSHGMVRESNDPAFKENWIRRHPDLNPDFIFAFPSYNVRSTELNAVLGRAQLPRLDANNKLRTRNLEAFLGGLDSKKFRTDFTVEGSSNYAFTLVICEPDPEYRDRVQAAMREAKVEHRRGTSGGGNELRQPYLRRLYPEEYKKYPQVDHVHFYGYYIGNYPSLNPNRIGDLTRFLNSI